MQEALNSGTLTREQIDEMREKITEKTLEILGPFKYLTVRIPLLSDFEDAVADLALGEEVEAVRKGLAELELPETFFENVCEAP